MTSELNHSGPTQRVAPAASGDRDPLLRFSDIGMRFGPVTALSGVDLEVYPGEIHALVGENGAGKSTLVNIATGALEPTSGTVEIAGEPITTFDPMEFYRRGIGVVRQNPDLIPDLTVSHNIFLAAEANGQVYSAKDFRAECEALLDPWKMDIAPDAVVHQLSMQQRFVVEIAKALVSKPGIMLFDEPTEHLNRREIDLLFEEIRRLASLDVGIVYISHRLSEVREISDRLSVLRDGVIRDTASPKELTDQQIVDLMAGRSQALDMPDKRLDAIGEGEQPVLSVEGLTAPGCQNISFSVYPGEIVGLAGIADSGQAAILRALAGTVRSSGTVTVGGSEVRRGSVSAAQSAGMVYIPANRARDGLLMPLSIEENIGHGDWADVSRLGVLKNALLRQRATEDIDHYRIKTPDSSVPVEQLSGGNQQKVLFARANRGKPTLLLADEPTQGVDVAARVDLYRSLRNQAQGGQAVLVVSSDSAELAKLCDRVLIVERGQIEREIAGDQLTEENITTAAVTSKVIKIRTDEPGVRRWSKLMSSSYAPSLTLTALILALAVFTTIRNPSFTSPANIGQLLALVAPLAVLAIGQTAVLMVGAIDLSIGPTAALVLVVSSFFLSEGAAAGSILFGVILALAAALLVAAVNLILIIPLKLDPFIATLVTFTGVQGVGLLLRPMPDGYFAMQVMDAIGFGFGIVPVSVVIVVALGVAAEFALRRTRTGLGLLAAGSSAAISSRLGIKPQRKQILAYLISACSAFIAGLLLIPQVGVGDPGVGTNYSLMAIAAAVLGGASLFGGRGSFVGAIVGAVLIVEISKIAAFLNVSSAWQLALQGILIVVGAALFSGKAAKGGVK